MWLPAYMPQRGAKASPNAALVHFWGVSSAESWASSISSIFSLSGSSSFERLLACPSLKVSFKLKFPCVNPDFQCSFFFFKQMLLDASWRFLIFSSKFVAYWHFLAWTSSVFLWTSLCRTVYYSPILPSKLSKPLSTGWILHVRLCSCACLNVHLCTVPNKKLFQTGVIL